GVRQMVSVFKVVYVGPDGELYHKKFYCEAIVEIRFEDVDEDAEELLALSEAQRVKGLDIQEDNVNGG
ncbi:unnamed protein product, partial [marine sediment metagenome]